MGGVRAELIPSCGQRCNLQVVEGERGRESYLFECNLVSGLELLTWIKGQTELTAIPVVVMSTSGDREQALSRGASEYLDKTPNFKSLIGILEACVSSVTQFLVFYWTNTSALQVIARKRLYLKKDKKLKKI